MTTSTNDFLRPGARLLAAAQARGLTQGQLTDTIDQVTGGRGIDDRSPAPLVDAVLDALEGGEGVVRLPHPEELPLSLDFEVAINDDGAISLRSRYPQGWDEARKAVYRRSKMCCEACGLKVGDRYRRPINRQDASGEWFTVGWKWAVQGPLCIAHLNHQPGDIRLSNLKALCNRCHTHHDALHHRGMSLLVQAQRRTLTRGKLAEKIALLNDRIAGAPRPAAALTVGGADLLVAVSLDRGLPLTPDALRNVAPRLRDATDEDLWDVIISSLARLRMRDMLAAQGLRLPLACDLT